MQKHCEMCDKMYEAKFSSHKIEVPGWVHHFCSLACMSQWAKENL